MANKSGALSVLKIAKMKEAGEKIAMVTAYDFPTAQMADAAGLDMILVGDSVGTVVQGRATTLGVTLDEMIYHSKMVAKGAKRALVVVDMPFPYCQLGPAEAVRACARVLLETEATAVKIEAGASRADTVRAVVEAGIPSSAAASPIVYSFSILHLSRAIRFGANATASRAILSFR